MKFEELTEDNKIENLIENIDNENYYTLIGNNIYTVFENKKEFICEDGKIFNTLNNAKIYLENNFNENLRTIEEELKIIKFNYKNFKHDSSPRVLVIDDDYQYKNGKKVKNQHDILGINLNYFDKKDKKEISKISLFAKKCKMNNEDTYKELAKKFPKSIKYIRQYKKDKMVFKK